MIRRRRRLLRARRERPCDCRAAKQRDKIAPSHIDAPCQHRQREASCRCCIQNTMPSGLVLARKF
jgi:hypothetical protein